MLSRLRGERGSWTLVGLLVAAGALIAIMFVVLLPRISPEGKTRQEAEKQGLVQVKEGQTVLGASIDKGKETSCMSNLRNIRMLIESTKAAGDQLPATLQDMRLGSGGVCPATGQPYQYDPTTGTVRCLTPGHQGL